MANDSSGNAALTIVLVLVAILAIAGVAYVAVQAISGEQNEDLNPSIDVNLPLPGGSESMEQ